MKKLFNRRDEQVKKDAESMTLQSFLQKYETETTVSVLTSVHKEYNKNVAQRKAIIKNTDEAVSLPPAEVDKKETTKTSAVAVTKKKIVEKQQVVVESSDNSQDIVQKIRELCQGSEQRLVSKEDSLAFKQEVRQKLRDLGYAAADSVNFHGTWTRLSNSILKQWTKKK